MRLSVKVVEKDVDKKDKTIPIRIPSKLHKRLKRQPINLSATVRDFLEKLADQLEDDDVRS